MAWKDIQVGFEGDGIKIGGLKIWGADWRATGDSVELPHPSYLQQLHPFRVYEIGDEQKPVQFAATELSNGVWGFYVPD